MSNHAVQPKAVKHRVAAKRKDVIADKKQSGATEPAVDAKTIAAATSVPAVKAQPAGQVKGRNKAENKKQQTGKSSVSEKVPASPRQPAEGSKRSGSGKRQRDKTVNEVDKKGPAAKRHAPTNAFSETIGSVFSRIRSSFEQMTQRVTGVSSSLLSSIMSPFSSRT
ncbi:hypothetical protein BBBOND_0205660 [Babesia bigemina]|uniref:Uncharacterized protein n=1 Tax=Babesia bigemina TaxID=5866 RepID=A0A061D4A5_BABBI|nr:hypothetical protein BBBOND_0205660 [Babesia bigemina]CDR95408.1 hypothetical protein BBBOND_0205660 [Babesia bigemina]|eukprot:XP_012767594.1 hypothetical protein BBBOND_0205660 [Babesia bigemina]